MSADKRTDVSQNETSFSDEDKRASSSGRSDGASLHKNPLTPIIIQPRERGVIGLFPEKKSDDMNIGIPEGSGDVVQVGDIGLVSIPGSHQTEATSPNLKDIDTVIYFMDKTGLRLTVEDGMNANAGELFEMVMSETNYCKDARELFSLWLVSENLELQLKPTHVPFKLVCSWDELLEKYSAVDEIERQRDEPVVMFQRNVFYPRDREKQVKDPQLLQLLYHEAKENVVVGRYPVSPELAEELAGLQLLIEHGEYDANASLQYKGKVGDYYRASLCETTWLGSLKRKPEERLRQRHCKASTEYQAELQNREHLYKTYLQKCWNLPYYGAAFFRGQVEHPKRSMIFNSPDDPVYVAISTDGLFIIDRTNEVFLFGVLYDYFKWVYAESQDKSNPACLPCLFLQFYVQEGADNVYKILQVFSKEAHLMDMLITTFTRMKAAGVIKEDVELDMTDGKRDGLVRLDAKTWHRFDKLCLTTLDKNGQIADSNVRGLKKSTRVSSSLGN